MITDPPGRVTSQAGTRDSLLSFAVQHPLRYLWGLGADAWIFTSTIVLGLLAIIGTLITRSGRPVDVLGRVWGRWILRVCGIDLEIGRGMFGLLGPNGAGKTTLMRTLAGIVNPTRGTVRVAGHDFDRRMPWPR